MAIALLPSFHDVKSRERYHGPDFSLAEISALIEKRYTHRSLTDFPQSEIQLLRASFEAFDRRTAAAQKRKI
jgi:hypothetical protein